MRKLLEFFKDSFVFMQAAIAAQAGVKMAKAKIYTKTGDQGQTSLVGGRRVSKLDERLDAYGTLDELNSSIGLLVSALADMKLAFAKSPNSLEFIQELLQVVQNSLFNVGSQLACEDPQMRSELPHISDEAIRRLELAMDQWESELPPLRQFILPGGSRGASLAHVARAICRRAERRALAVHETDPQDANSLIFLNRLSDFLFLLARLLNQAVGVSDVTWNK